MKRILLQFISFKKAALCLMFCMLFFGIHAQGQLRKLYQDTNEDNHINKISFYSPGHGYVGFWDWVGFTTDSGKTFTKKHITINNVDFNGYGVNLTFGFVINGVYAFSQDTLLAYGHYGLVPSILYSVNGGNNFKLIFHDQYNPLILRTGIQDLCFPQNGSIGYAIDADRVLKTTDKGLNWTKVIDAPGNYFDWIEPIDNNNIIVINNSNNIYRVMKITGGGSGFSFLNVPNTGQVKYAHFINASKGWLHLNSSDGGRIYYTSNGGFSWTLKNDPAVTPLECNKMRFINDSVGYAFNEQYLSLKTTDSGRTWEPLWRDNNFSYLGYSHEDLQYRNGQIWFGGDYGFLEMGSNGGQTRPTPYFKTDTSGSYLAGQVKLLNYSKTHYQFKWFVNGVQVGSGYNGNYIHDKYHGDDTIRLVASNGILSDTLEKIQPFIPVPYPPPAVTAFTPNTGGTGTTINITGEFFANVQQVYIGDIPVSSFTVNSLTSITAVVGAGGNGAVSVKTVTGNGEKAGYIFFPPPTITGFSPQSGPIGTTVTISGNNFSSVPSENNVYFGPAKAQVIAASNNQLQVNVPIGTNNQPISITVNKHRASSTQTFNVTFPTSCGFTAKSFAPIVPLESGINTTAVRLADFDQDDKPDLYFGSLTSVIVKRNTSVPGKISYGQTIDSAFGIFHYGLDAIDLDGDNYPELIAASMQQGKITILKNNSSPGQINFGQNWISMIGQEPASVAFDDLDNDGKPDMVVVLGLSNLNKLAVFRNTSINGSISFERKPDIITSSQPNKIYIRDLNNDGKKDLLVLNRASFSFAVHRNKSELGVIRFAPKVDMGNSVGAISDAALGDFNKDGKIDVTIAVNGHYSIPNNSLDIYENTSIGDTITFAEKNSNFGGTDPGGIIASDFDGDNKIDIAASYTFFGSVEFFKNNSNTNLSFPNIKNSMQGNYIKGLADGDFDGDGKLDVASALGVYRNTIGEKGVMAGKDTAVCDGRSIQIGASPNFEYQYSWSSIPAGFSSTEYAPIVSPTIETKYVVSTLGPLGCTSTDTVIVRRAGPAPVSDAGPLINRICRGDSVVLGTPAQPGLTYFWRGYNGYTSTEAQPKVSPVFTSQYILTVSNGTCSSNDTTTVIVADPPAGNAGPDKGSCLGIGTTIGLYNTSGNTYQWTSNPAGFTSSAAIPFINPSVNTTYYLVESNGYCYRYDTVNITVVSAPLANAGPDQVLCSGNTTTIGTPALPGLTYAWDSSPFGFSSGLANPQISPNSTFTYFLRVSNSGCTSRDTVVVTVPPLAFAGNDQTICTGGSATIGSTATTGSVYSWTSLPAGFTSSVAMPVVNPMASTRYILQLQNNGCTSTDTVLINVTTAPAAGVIATAPDSTTCGGAPITFTAIPINGGTNPSFQWKKNGVNVGTNNIQYTDGTLQQNDLISVVMTSNGTCVFPLTATSNSIKITALPNQTLTVTISGNGTVNIGQATLLTANVNTNTTASINYGWSDSTSTHNWASIPGGNNQTLSYTPANTGDKVRVLAWAFTPCGTVSDTSNLIPFIVNAPTAISDPAFQKGIKVFPNPVQNILIIDSLKLADRWTEMEIVSLDGKPVLKHINLLNKTHVIVPVAHLPNGTYAAILRSKSNRPVHLKFIKQ